MTWEAGWRYGIISTVPYEQQKIYVQTNNLISENIIIIFPFFTNINGLHGNRDELAIAATKFDVVACAETKVTGRRHVSELSCLVSKLLLCC